MPEVTCRRRCAAVEPGAAPVVTMKNCDPFVFAGVGHRERAAHDLVVVELVLELVAGPARAGAHQSRPD
jgi:hypothetical protein